MDTAVILVRSGFLDLQSQDQLEKVSKVFSPASSHLLPTWITRPWQPFRPRNFGFGAAQAGRSTVHDRPNPMMAVHYAWSFLSLEDRSAAVATHPSWWKYAKLRSDSVVTPISCLRAPRTWIPTDKYPTTLDPERAQLHSLSLLRFDFDHGDVIRWLGGEYTNAHRQFDEEWVKILHAMDKFPPKECPPVHPIAAYRVHTQGVPLKAAYTTPYYIPAIRDAYDNHPAVAENEAKVEAKFAKEEWKAYHIHYHRWLFCFIYGIIINPIQWVWDKGKGRICIDCSNGPPDKSGSVNTYIPKPFNVKKPPKNMILDQDECPGTYFKYAFKRVLRRILRMRITRPKEPILAHADDIDAAFRRILYHPDMAVAFAYFFSDYLLVPVSQVFGGRSCPPNYGLLADVRELLAMVRPLDSPSDFHPLVLASSISWDQSTPLVTIPEDSHHPPLADDELDDPFQASYVDDMATVSFAKNMKAAVDNSVKAAFAVFGEGGTDRRGDCLQMDKWESDISERFRFLGFDVDTHSMTITWPRYKREALKQEITEILARTGNRRFVSPKEMAHLVGVVRSASEVAPWGTFLSFNLQNALTKAARNANNPKRTWYSRSKIYLSATAVATLKQLSETLLCDDDRTWTRPIALFFDRDPTHRVYSDASYIGIGGWSPDLCFLWRITRDDMIRFGFDMKAIGRLSSEPVRGKTPGLHINPLEYVAALVNLWISLVLIIEAGDRDGGYILQLNADNTTALAWMSEAARTPDPFLQGLARLGSALLVAAARLLTKVLPTHIPGKQNTEADALSRPVGKNDPRIPSLASVIMQWQNLRTCRIFLLPTKLLRTIADVTSSRRTEVSFDAVTTELLTLKVNSLSPGAKNLDLTSTVYGD